MIRKIVFVLIICVVSLATFSVQAKESLANKMFEWWKQATPQMVEDLIEKGADVNEIGTMGNNALMWASGYNKNPEIIDILIKHGADISTHSTSSLGNTVLMDAAWTNPNPEIIDKLIYYGAKVDEKDNSGQTSLMYAVRHNKNPAITEKLIQYGSDIEATNKYGRTILMEAANSSKNSEILAILINSGANIKVKDENGRTALSYAASNFYLDSGIIETLIKQGADVNEKDNEGWTALMQAAAFNHDAEVIETLIKYGANVNERDNDGMTALMHAASSNAGLKVLNTLIKHGADLNIKDKAGKTAWDYAVKKDAKNILVCNTNPYAQTNTETSIEGCINCDIDADIFLKIDNRIYFVLDKTNKSALFGYFNREETTEASLVYWDEKENKLYNVYDGIDSRDMYYAQGRFYLRKYKPTDEENDDNFSVVFSIDKNGKNYKEYGDGKIISFDKENDTLGILTEYHRAKYNPDTKAEAKVNIVQNGEFIRTISLSDDSIYNIQIRGDNIWYGQYGAIDRINWKNPEEKSEYKAEDCWPEGDDVIACNELINVVQNKNHTYAILESRQGSGDFSQSGVVYEIDLSNDKAELLYQIPDGVINGWTSVYVSPNISFYNDGHIKLLSRPKEIIEGHDFIIRNNKLCEKRFEIDHFVCIPIEPNKNIDTVGAIDDDGTVDKHDHNNIIVEDEKRIGDKVYAIITRVGRDVDGDVGWREGYFNLKTWYVVKDLITREIKVMASVEMKDNIEKFLTAEKVH